ncbi:acyl-CoA N-acyltransferase [Setomelanomma holmii]|uniref:Acyl-CoA N-acyltransferase n=1 Tax=Setomelanomma holmii TaxID=210430 RepID=A0A9P4LR01_9PLEO|nr:acyl-CoA N-acyltransferase [Setomelanomma holmii]
MAQQSTPAHPANVEAQIQTSPVSKDDPIPAPIVKTARLVIRALHPQDAESMSINGNSPGIARYMSFTFPNPYTITHGETWIAQNLMPRPNNFGICESSSPDVVIGGIGLKPGANVYSHTAEVGFWVGEKYWGEGYTTEALEGFVKWSFESWRNKDSQKLERIFGFVYSANVASMRCFEKCGFAKEGVMKAHAKKHGEFIDIHIFGLPKVDWEGRQ